MEESSMATSCCSRRRSVDICNCGGKIRVFTSWTSQNPGRRFWRCPNYRNIDSYGFFEWMDPPVSQRAREIVEEKQKMVVSLKKKVKVYRVLMFSSWAVTLFVIVVLCIVWNGQRCREVGGKVPINVLF